MFENQITAQHWFPVPHLDIFHLGQSGFRSPVPIRRYKPLFLTAGRRELEIQLKSATLS
jgi:hypothetical protein